jgi:hypothetical protein
MKKERVAFPSALRWFLLRTDYPLPHPTKLEGSLFRLVPAEGDRESLPK